MGGLTLRAGLAWMTARHWLHFEAADGRPALCVVTGEPLTEGLVAREVTKWSTGVGYGAKGSQEEGTRAERLFRHPNVPTFKRYNPKTGQHENEQPYRVDRQTGLVNALGSTFFGRTPQDAGRGRHLAPVVAQLYDDGPIYNLGLTPRLLVFGFHMLGDNTVHGGFERDAFAYRLLGRTPDEAVTLMDAATARVEAAAAFADAVARLLQRAVQTTAGAGVRAKENEDGRIVLEKTDVVKSADFAFGRDVLADYWRAVGRLMGELAGWIADAAAGGPGALGAAKEEITARWEEAVVGEARRLYRPVFEAHAVLPRTMPFAHVARRLFNGALNKARTVHPETATP